MRPHFIFTLLALGLAQCSEPKGKETTAAPVATPTAGLVQVVTPKRVIVITEEGAAPGKLKTAYASVVVLNGLPVALQAATVGCRLTDGMLFAGDLPEPLPPGAAVGVPAWPTPRTDIELPETWLPVIERCGLIQVVAGGRQALAPQGVFLKEVGQADFKDSPP